jgi:hypothetical protein
VILDAARSVAGEFVLPWAQIIFIHRRQRLGEGPAVAPSNVNGAL